MALLYILVALLCLPATITPSSTNASMLEPIAGFLHRVVHKSFLGDLGSLFRQAFLRHQHHRHDHSHHRRRHKYGCDEFKWKPNIASDENVTLTLTVDLKGCGQFNSIQKAVDAVPDNGPGRTLIVVDSGIYKEKVLVNANKVNLRIKGRSYLNTIISWNDTAQSTQGTAQSSSMSVLAANFIAHNISFENTTPPPSPGDDRQAVAMRIAGDQAAFYGCGFYGAQDTLLDERGRHYFSECFIQGSIDFIFGNGRSLYQNCLLNSIAQAVPGIAGGITGAITAHYRQEKSEKTGFAFLNCVINGTGKVVLGRAWGPYATVVFSKTSMPAIIAPEGWNNWNDPERERTIFFGEYSCTGPGADYSRRVAYSKQLNECQAAPFMDISYIEGDGWAVPVTGSHFSGPCSNHRHKELIDTY